MIPRADEARRRPHRGALARVPSFGGLPLLTISDRLVINEEGTQRSSKGQRPLPRAERKKKSWAQAYILDAVRTPRGRGKAGKGSLSGIHPQELLGQSLQRLVTTTKVDPALVDDVISGCVSQVNEQGAKHRTRGGPPRRDGRRRCRRRPSIASVARACRQSPLRRWASLSGQQHLVVGGGVESMSRVPMGSDGGDTDGLNLHLRQKIAQVPQGICADLIATLEGFSRQELDAWALNVAAARRQGARGESIRAQCVSGPRSEDRRGRSLGRRVSARHDRGRTRPARSVVRRARQLALLTTAATRSTRSHVACTRR